MNKLTAIRIKYDDGTYSDEIPVSTLAEYILWDDSHNLVDILGNIDMSKGTVQAQLNDKIDDEALAQYLRDEISTDVTNWLNTYVTPVGSAVIVDSNLTTEGAAADAKKTGDELTELNERIDSIEPGLSDTAKVALLNCFQHVAWVDEDGQDYYDALEYALYASAYPRITAIYTSGAGTIYTVDALDTLKQYLTVTYYEDVDSVGVTIPSTDYTLSGTLIEGTSVVTVTYENVVTKVSIPNVVDFYNIWTWSMGDGRLQKVVGSVDLNQSDTTKYPSKAMIRTDVPARRNFNTTRGILPYYLYNQTAVSSGYYPIPVPRDANHMKITLTPSTQYIFAQVFAYNASNNTYSNSYSQNRIGWAAGLGGGEIDIDRPNNEQSMFLVINTKYNDAGTSYPSEPTGLTIEFSEV